MTLNNERKLAALAKAHQAIALLDQQLAELEKAKVIAQLYPDLELELHEVLNLYDKVIASHYSKMAQGKKNPNQERAIELIEQFKAQGDSKFIKSAWVQFDKEQPNIYTLESFRTLYKRKK
jgi:hypothetical protein